MLDIRSFPTICQMDLMNLRCCSFPNSPPLADLNVPGIFFRSFGYIQAKPYVLFPERLEPDARANRFYVLRGFQWRVIVFGKARASKRDTGPSLRKVITPFKLEGTSGFGLIP